MQSFADLGVSPVVVRALSKRGIQSPFAIQNLVIADVLAGRDVLAQSPTGSGKTLAFGVPIVDRVRAADARPAALILAPTRELAVQIVDELREVAHAHSLSVAPVYGGVALEKQAKIARRSHIIVATPGRLEDLLDRRFFSLDQIRILVLDEADRMLDMGFKPAVDRIVALTPEDRQTLFFSATLAGEAGRVAAAYTRDATRHEHAAPAQARGKVDHHFVAVTHEGKIDALVEQLRHEGRGRTLVFVRTKRGADRLVKRLRNQSLEALAMHGDKTQSQRERALARFDEGDVDTLVATDVAARGIDVEDITHVINFDIPVDRDTYVHRVGRTGRAGRTGTGITFVMSDQAKEMGAMARALDLESDFERSGLRGPAPAPAPRPAQRPRGPRRRSRAAASRRG